MWQKKRWPLVYGLAGGGLIIGAGLGATFARDELHYFYASLLLIAAGGMLLGLALAADHRRRSGHSITEGDRPEGQPRLAPTLARLTEIVNSTLELNQVLNLSLEQLAEVLPYDAAFILLAETSGLKVAATAGLVNWDNWLNATITMQTNEPLAEVMAERQSRVIADTRQFEGWRSFYEETAAPAPRAWLGAPLVAQDECIGILILEKRTPGFYAQENGDLAATFAAQIATAVQNARLFNDLRHKALEVAVMADNLNEEKSKLDAILKHIADGLVVTDAEGTIQLVNPAFEQMFSRPATTLADRSTTHIEELQRLITRALAGQQTTVTDISLSDGRILRASLGVIREETRTLGVVTVLRDITREKEVDRMKSEFISTVSHELRTPLTSVLGFAKHINKIFNKHIVPKVPPDDPKAQRTMWHISQELEIIVIEGERLTRLINDLLDIAKMESGKLEWHMAEVSLAEVIQRAVIATSRLAAAKNLPVEVQISPNLRPVWGDMDRLIQVVTNLLSNAIKFTDSGQITIWGQQVEIGEDGSVTPPGLERLSRQYMALLEPGYWLVISIRDTGIGISRENLPYVFEKFKQVGDVLTDRPAGSGLGIPICKEIIEQHGGRIWAESELEVGSTFICALPLSLKVKPKPATPPGDQADISTGQKESQLILVVDDEANVRHLLREELMEAGYRVIEAVNGLDALTKARQEKPDLIILDVMMPGLNGFDVTSVLKGDEATLHIPILILSIVEDKEHGFRLGAEDYLTKPLEAEQLLQSIANLLMQAD